MCIQEGRNQAAADAAAQHLRGTLSDPANSADFVRSWLRPYIAQPVRNPDHKRAFVETLIRYGTTHVQRGVNLEDVKDALAIEFLAQVDGKPVPIDGFDNTLFIGTIGELCYYELCIFDTGNCRGSILLKYTAMYALVSESAISYQRFFSIVFSPIPTQLNQNTYRCRVQLQCSQANWYYSHCQSSSIGQRQLPRGHRLPGCEYVHRTDITRRNSNYLDQDNRNSSQKLHRGRISR